MALATIEFPRSLLRERTGRLELSRRVVSPGLGGSGVLPLIATDGGGLWELDYGAVALTKPDHIRAWEAMAAISDGGATPFVVPFCGCVEAPVALDAVTGKPIFYPPLPFSDPVFFSDGSGFAQASTDIRVSGVWPLRSTTMRVFIALGSPLRGGEHFSIMHPTAGWRLYRIVQAFVDEPVGYTTITIRPPLREAIDTTTILDFDNPRCTMQLANPKAMDLTRDLRRFGSPSASFIEAFP